MFDGATPAWEDLQGEPEAGAAEPEASVAEPPRPSASLQAKTARSADHEAVAQQPPADAIGVGGDERDEAGLEHAELRAAGGGAAAAARPSLLSTSKDPLKVDGKTNPHGGPFEHKLAHADKHDHFAATDDYNKPGVHSDKIGAHVAARPGVISEGKGLFTLKHNATRYTYTASGDHNVATPFDVIDKARLTSFNAKAHLSKAEAAKAKDKKRLMLNPSKPRELVINGTPMMCVLSWTDGFGGGAAWIPLNDLAGDHSKILHSVQARAKKWDPSVKLSEYATYVIADNKVSHADKAHEGNSKGRVLAPGAKGGDNVSHYLEKDEHKPKFDAAGKKTKVSTEVGFVALAMNLPEHGTPPVAVDTALRGDTFFAFTNPKFHREVSVYENGTKHSKLRQTWVFGHLGQHKGGTGADAAAMEPDPNRAGWVPLRVLKLP